MSISLYKYQCLTMALCIKELMKNYIFPKELIWIIIDYYLDLQNHPMLVILDSDASTHCNMLRHKWYIKGGIMDEIHKFYPRIRFLNLIFKRCGSNETKDNIQYPYDLKRYNRWNPMIILIPGPLWDHTLINSNIRIVDGVQIFNGKFDLRYEDLEPKVYYEQKYDIHRSNEFIQWLDDCYKNNDFISKMNF